METSPDAIVRGSHRRENHGLRFSLEGRELSCFLADVNQVLWI